MDENLKNAAANCSDAEPGKRDESRAARIKKMRGWLSVRSAASPNEFDEEIDSTYYGDGHSGWNR